MIFNKQERKDGSSSIARNIFFSFIFAEALCLGAFLGLHSEPKEAGGTDVETVALDTPSAFVEPSESIVEPIVIESFTADIPFEEYVEDVDEEYIESYFDVPLAEEIQDHIFKLCEENDLDPAIIIAMIDKESKYTIDIIGDKGKSYGLMQIQPRWHSERMKELGVDDLLDPCQNITVGIDILVELLDSGKSLEWALTAYNGGHAYANRLANEGRVGSYASSVLEIAENLERR